LENYVTTLIKNAKRKFPRQAFFLKKKMGGEEEEEEGGGYILYAGEGEEKYR